MNPRWTIAVATCACAAAGTYTYSVDPSSGGYPTCLLYRTTGYYCAGCGATRAIHALLHGRVMEALHDNLLFVALLPVVAAFILPMLVRAWRDKKWPAIYVPQQTIALRGVTLFAIAVLFMTMRNLPSSSFDWLRPLA